MPADGRLAAVEATFTIAPAPRSRIPGSAAWIARTALITLICQDCSQIVLGQLVEAADLGVADVVDEAVDAAEALDRGARRRARARPGCGEVGGDVQVADARRRGGPVVTTVAPSACEQARDLEADARRSSR